MKKPWCLPSFLSRHTFLARNTLLSSKLQELTFDCLQASYIHKLQWNYCRTAMRNNSVVTIRHFSRGQNPNLRRMATYTPSSQQKICPGAVHASARKLCLRAQQHDTSLQQSRWEILKRERKRKLKVKLGSDFNFKTIKCSIMKWYMWNWRQTDVWF